MEALAARYPSHRAQCSAHINSRGHVGTAPLIVWSLPRLPRSSHRAWRGATLAEWGFDLSTINRLYSVAHDESHREWKCEVVSMSSSKVPWLGLRPECEVSATLLDLILVVPAEHPSDMTEALRTGYEQSDKPLSPQQVLLEDAAAVIVTKLKLTASEELPFPSSVSPGFTASLDSNAASAGKIKLSYAISQSLRKVSGAPSSWLNKPDLAAIPRLRRRLQPSR